MNWPVIPVALPLLAGLVLILLGRSSALRRSLAVAVAAGQLMVALGLAWANFHGDPQVLRVGGWPVPFGIVLVVDLFSAIMLSLSALMALACLVFGLFETRLADEHPLRLPLFFFLNTGINLSFVTGDLFNLFVAFEVMLLSSYALMSLEAGRRGVREAYPYLALNMVGSALFLAAAGLAYGLFGSLNFADIIVRSAAMPGDFRITLLALLLLVVFGLKAGIFPLYYWLPNSYPIMPAAMAAFFSETLTKVGIYVLIRVFGTVLPHDLTGVHLLIAWLAGASMVFGVFGAVARGRIQQILAYHIISQVGFIVLAVGFFTETAFAAAIFYILHNIVVKATLFLVGGAAIRLNGTDDLTRTANLWQAAPWLGIVFLLQAMSLAGLPPLSGFWGKYLIILEGLSQGQWVLVGLAILTSVFTLVSMLKIWFGAFWRTDERVAVATGGGRRGMIATGLALAAVSVTVGLVAEPFIRATRRAAVEVLDRRGYAAHVFAQNHEIIPGKHPAAGASAPAPAAPGATAASAAAAP